LIGCNDLDIWLAAHLADLFDKLAMLPDEERFDMSLRDHFLLEYADLLAMHPRHASFWDIIVDYLYAAGPEGRLRLKEFIMHVGLDAPPPTISPDAADEDDAMEVDIADPKLEHFAKIREVCASHELEEEFEAISQIIADRMVKSGQYGIAATIYATSGNAVGMSDLADSLLGVYVAEGEHETA
jgi:nuclear pore complex protein Nup85